MPDDTYETEESEGCGEKEGGGGGGAEELNISHKWSTLFLEEKELLLVLPTLLWV